jgi:hypothetical protein
MTDYLIQPQRDYQAASSSGEARYDQVRAAATKDRGRRRSNG